MRERLPIVYIDDLDSRPAWTRNPREPRWDATCDDDVGGVERAGFDDVDDAIAWGRERAEIVLVRLGPTEDEAYSAGSRQATHELPERGGTDLTPFAPWPPPGWS